MRDTIARNSIWKKIGASLAAGAIAISALTPPSFAHASTDQSSNDPYVSGSSSASDGEASSKYYIQADDTKISASVPTEIHIKVGGDGKLYTPENATIKNGSIFDIHVSCIKATKQNDFHLVKKDEVQTTTEGTSQTYNGTDSDAIYLVISTGGSSELVLGDCVDNSGFTVNNDDWNLKKYCEQDSCDSSCMPEDTTQPGEKDTLLLGENGYMYKIEKDLGQDQEFAQVTWTFKAGKYSTNAGGGSNTSA